MTIEEQKAYVRRYVEGCRAASEDQLETARHRTEAEAWEAAERVLGGTQDFGSARLARRESSGLVEQQRWFMRLHRR